MNEHEEWEKRQALRFARGLVFALAVSALLVAITIILAVLAGVW